MPGAGGQGGIDAYQTCLCEEADGREKWASGSGNPLLGNPLLRNPLFEKDLACLGDIILFWGFEGPCPCPGVSELHGPSLAEPAETQRADVDSCAGCEDMWPRPRWGIIRWS